MLHLTRIFLLHGYTNKALCYCPHVAIQANNLLFPADESGKTKRRVQRYSVYTQYINSSSLPPLISCVQFHTMGAFFYILTTHMLLKYYFIMCSHIVHVLILP